MPLTIEERVAALEADVEQLKARNGEHAKEAWWKSFVGAFENDPLFEEAVRHGKAYRESLQPAQDGSGDDGV